MRCIMKGLLMTIACASLASAGIALADESQDAVADQGGPPPEAVQPPTPAPTQVPPAPPGEPPPPPEDPAEQQAQAPGAPSPGQAAGQWVYTSQYGWVFMPYGNQYVHEGTVYDEYPYAYVYYPSYGWIWLASPWLWGWGPYPYFGAWGPWHYGWYHGLVRGGHGWGRYRGGGPSHSPVGPRGGYWGNSRPAPSGGVRPNYFHSAPGAAPGGFRGGYGGPGSFGGGRGFGGGHFGGGHFGGGRR
jgi:hypothetical protein